MNRTQEIATTMNIGFYFGGIDLRSGGVSPYADRLFRVLSDHTFDQSIDIVPIRHLNPKDGNACWRIGQSAFNRMRDSVRVLLLPGPVGARLSPPPRCRSNLQELTLLHVPFQVAPECDVPYICTMHDVQELHFPQYFTSAEREWRAIHYRRSIANAAHIVVSYEHVKQDIIRFFGCAEDDISVMPLPIAGCEASPQNFKDTRASETKFKTFGKFILYPAQTWEHKNHLGLIEAFEIASKQLATPLTLVCTGTKKEHYRIIEERVNRSSQRSHIHFTGIVSDEELEWLYKNSVGVVIPTLYEAGSFPLIESMMRSTPVICANTTSLPKTIGNLEFVFDPLNINQMAISIVQLVCDQDFRARNLANGSRQIEVLRDIDTGAAFEKLWRRVIHRIDGLTI